MRNSTKTSDKEFVAMLLQHQGKLLNLLHCLVFEKQAIPDLLQEINVDLLSNESEYDPSLTFFPWACGRARYVVKSYLLSKKRSRIIFDDEIVNRLWEDATQFIEDEYEGRANLLRQCVEKLQKGQRSLFELHYARGLKPAQIAAKLDKKPNTVSQILHRIRLAIINCVEKKQSIVRN